MTRRIKGGIKRREADPASNQFPKCSPQLRTEGDSPIRVEKKRGRGEIRGDLLEKKESQKRERAIRPVILLPGKNGY